jgi:hypothetical protein
MPVPVRGTVEDIEVIKIDMSKIKSRDVNLLESIMSQMRESQRFYHKIIRR